MGDVSSEPTMEEILSSIKRVIEESETSPSPATARKPRAARTIVPPSVADADEVLELSERVPFPQAPREPEVERVAAPPSAPAATRADSLVSPDAAEASRGSLEALSRLVVKPDTAGADTLEGLVRELLRPMLRDWLDAHLPQIVEAMVAKEIARISGRGL